MSLEYKAVAWNRDKKVYDSVLAIGIIAYLTTFLLTGVLLFPTATAETLLIRAFGTLALLLLHIILVIGPLCRLQPAFLPLLYNRRHLGVTMFAFALAHGLFAIFQFHSGGDVNPLLSLLTSGASWTRITAFPFQLLGALALFILFILAATSHDFWLHNLTAPIWKALHMLVYLAYAVLIGHVSLGFLQSETNWIYAVLLASGLLTLTVLHTLAAVRESTIDANSAYDGEFIEVCRISDIPEKRARIVSLSGERVAVFRYDGMVSAVSNVCQHQNGPLGEGKIIAGCITCPWHGYQYLPDSGASPAPFTEMIPTFQVKVIDNRVLVHPTPHAPGTRLEPARIGAPCHR